MINGCLCRLLSFLGFPLGVSLSGLNPDQAIMIILETTLLPSRPLFVVQTSPKIEYCIHFMFFFCFFSPSGKLVQIEYALNAVTAGSPSVGIIAQNGVVIATEKKQKSVLYDEHTTHKVEKITENIGMIYSGMGPDYR